MAIRIETLAPGACSLAVQGRIEKTDVEMAMAAIETAKSESEKVNLLVDLTGFAGFDIAALIQDVRRGIGEWKDISRYDRVAVITDRAWMDWMTKVEGSALPNVSIRTFGTDEVENARRYVLGEEVAKKSPPPALHLLAADRPDVLAFAVRGRLTQTDIKAFNQLLEEKMAGFREVDVLVRLEGKLPSFDPAIFFSGNSWATNFSAWKRLRRYGLVGAPQMLGGATDFLGAMMPFDVKTFPADREDDAWQWIGARPTENYGSHDATAPSETPRP
ncbi:STAS/SEC14 domain-containing protein [Notoacmeibacter ruber]|uniref:STAS/SEC14 domain-containing protein n=1 Tax=Notoacmeibacter ruber TaxID=2670375 RepID=A0A3L7JBM3_9HYPH|nr:STAS/SEC14 domain-containing protein [Notoacmeibacter ruber]RLQ88137.1 STAS/SEC14 domain-containing protein [Notoacmeibacter ruber]